MLGGLTESLLLRAPRRAASVLFSFRRRLLDRPLTLWVDDLHDGHRLVGYPLVERREGNGRGGGARGSEEEHESHHLRREVHRDEEVRRDEKARGRTLVEHAHYHADRPSEDVEVKVLEVHVSLRRLVLRHGVHERVTRARVRHEEAADARGQRAHLAGLNDRDEKREDSGDAVHDHAAPEDGKFPLAHLLALNVHKSVQVGDDENKDGTHLLHGLQRHPSHDRHPDGQRGAREIKDGVRLVQVPAEVFGAVDDELRGGVHAHHVEHEGVPSPRGDHVEIGQRRDESDGPRLVVAKRSNPPVERGRHRGHGDALVVECSSDGSHEVRGDDGHEPAPGGERAPLAPLDGGLERDATGEDAREDGEPRGEEHADVVERDVHPEPPGEHVVDRGRGDLHSGVDCSAHGPAQRVPHAVVVPGEEFVPPVVYEVLRGAKVEPRVELVDHATVPLHRKQADLVGRDQRQRDDDHPHGAEEGITQRLLGRLDSLHLNGVHLARR